MGNGGGDSNDMSPQIIQLDTGAIIRVVNGKQSGYCCDTVIDPITGKVFRSVSKMGNPTGLIHNPAEPGKIYYIDWAKSFEKEEAVLAGSFYLKDSEGDIITDTIQDFGGLSSTSFYCAFANSGKIFEFDKRGKFIQVKLDVTPEKVMGISTSGCSTNNNNAIIGITTPEIYPVKAYISGSGWTDYTGIMRGINTADTGWMWVCPDVSNAASFYKNTYGSLMPDNSVVINARYFNNPFKIIKYIALSGTCPALKGDKFYSFRGGYTGSSITLTLTKEYDDEWNIPYSAFVITGATPGKWTLTINGVSLGINQTGTAPVRANFFVNGVNNISWESTLSGGYIICHEVVDPIDINYTPFSIPFENPVFTDTLMA